MSADIEQAIQRDDWKTARRLIRGALRQEPNSHWLLARLALTYYEDFNYERALTFGKQAYDLAPRCPLVLWELAGSHEMLGHRRDAITLFRGLIRQGVQGVAFGDCGEGLAWARGLIADCWYRLAHCERDLGHQAKAIRCYKKHLAMRGPGCRSIYALRDVRKELQLIC